MSKPNAADAQESISGDITDEKLEILTWLRFVAVRSPCWQAFLASTVERPQPVGYTRASRTQPTIITEERRAHENKVAPY